MEGKQARESQIDAIIMHFGTVTDGVWEPRKDIYAALKLGGYLCGYLSAAWIAIQSSGVLSAG